MSINNAAARPTRPNRARSAPAASPGLSLRTDPIVRIAPGATGVSIWSADLFEHASSIELREFLQRVFTVSDVAEVEIRRDAGFGRVIYRKAADPSEIWRKLSLVLKGARPAEIVAELHAGDGSSKSAARLFLEAPPRIPIRVTRVGGSLSTWRLRHHVDGRVRLAHPILRKQKDVAYRLEEELLTILGVRACRASTLSGSVAIRFDTGLVSADRLVRQLESIWPRLLSGLEGPPSSKRLLAAGGLLGLSVAGQFFVPLLRPLALAGVAIYGFPNVATAAKQLKRLQVGLPALYAFGLILLILSGGGPLNSTIMAVLMQSWPRLARQTMSKSQRRLFALHRQRPTWARLRHDDGTETDVDLDILRRGDLVVIRTGDIVPVDGIVVDGLAAVDEEPLSGVAGALDKVAGDPVCAASYVRDGQLLVRMERTGADTIAQSIAASLPHATIDHLPSAIEAERIANRNAKPALALAAASLFVRRLVRPSQAIIRPDYITAHRLGAQLAALHDLGSALQHGILFRDTAALDRLAATDIYVIDESAALTLRRIEIANVFPVGDVSETEILGYAAAAFPPLQNERSRALRTACAARHAALADVHDRKRRAGAVTYRDAAGHLIEVATPGYPSASKTRLPLPMTDAIARHGRGADAFLRPLLVLRNREVVGLIAFERQGHAEGAETIANLRSINKRARFVHVSSRSQVEAEGVAADVGIDVAIGNLDARGKAAVLRDLGPRTMWVGDGSLRESLPCLKACNVSISVAGFDQIATDAADIVFLQASLQSLVSLRRLAREHRAHLESDYRALYATNLVGVAGGMFANFGGLQAGLLSNAGTGYVYARYWRRLRGLVARVEGRRAALVSAGFEETGRLAEKIQTRPTDVEKYVDHREPNASGEPMEPATGI